MSQRRWLLAVALLVPVVVVIAFALPTQRGFGKWIEEVRDGDADRGWDLLSAEVRSNYGGRRDAYLADVDAVDWGALVLTEPEDLWEDDGFHHVVMDLRSEPSTVPLFLFERRIVHAICDGDQPSGLGVFEDRRLFGGGGFGGGGVTGSQRECQAAFRDAGR